MKRSCISSRAYLRTTSTSWSCTASRPSGGSARAPRHPPPARWPGSPLVARGNLGLEVKQDGLRVLVSHRQPRRSRWRPKAWPELAPGVLTSLPPPPKQWPVNGAVEDDKVPIRGVVGDQQVPVLGVEDLATLCDVEILGAVPEHLALIPGVEGLTILGDVVSLPADLVPELVRGRHLPAKTGLSRGSKMRPVTARSCPAFPLATVVSGGGPPNPSDRPSRGRTRKRPR